MNNKENITGQEIEVSIFTTTYNSEWKKLRHTFDSVLAQKNITYEIIISDDGSIENNSTEIREYFEEKNFTQYILLENSNNVGTVRNCIRAIERTKGTYVKGLGPGDCLIGSNALSDWVSALKSSKKSWSFCEEIYYRSIDEREMAIESHMLLPRNIIPYEMNDIDAIKYRYAIWGDRISGTSTILKRDMWFGYLQRISQMIKYAEDLSLSIMILEGELPFYYKHNAVAYEFGTGISTSGTKKWEKILQQEVQTVNDYVKGMSEYQRLVDKKAAFSCFETNQTSKRMSSLYFDAEELTPEIYAQCCQEKWQEIENKSRSKNIWIYGAGFGGKTAADFFNKQGINIAGYVDQNYKTLKEVNGLKVVGIEEINTEHDFMIITLLEIRLDVINEFRKYGITDRNYIYIPAMRRIDTQQFISMCMQ